MLHTVQEYFLRFTRWLIHSEANPQVGVEWSGSALHKEPNGQSKNVFFLTTLHMERILLQRQSPINQWRQYNNNVKKKQLGLVAPHSLQVAND